MSEVIVVQTLFGHTDRHTDRRTDTKKTQDQLLYLNHWNGQ